MCHYQDDMPDAEIQGLIWKNSGWISWQYTNDQSNLIRDHLSNTFLIYWIGYAIAEPSIMEC